MVLLWMPLNRNDAVEQKQGLAVLSGRRGRTAPRPHRACDRCQLRGVSKLLKYPLGSSEQAAPQGVLLYLRLTGPCALVEVIVCAGDDGLRIERQRRGSAMGIIRLQARNNRCRIMNRLARPQATHSRSVFFVNPR